MEQRLEDRKASRGEDWAVSERLGKPRVREWMYIGQSFEESHSLRSSLLAVISMWEMYVNQG